MNIKHARPFNGATTFSLDDMRLFAKLLERMPRRNYDTILAELAELKAVSRLIQRAASRKTETRRTPAELAHIGRLTARALAIGDIWHGLGAARSVRQEWQATGFGIVVQLARATAHDSMPNLDGWGI
jgi:hypothetical protein